MLRAETCIKTGKLAGLTKRLSALTRAEYFTQSSLVKKKLGELGLYVRTLQLLVSMTGNFLANKSEEFVLLIYTMSTAKCL